MSECEQALKHMNAVLDIFSLPHRTVGYAEYTEIERRLLRIDCVLVIAKPTRNTVLG